MDAEAYDEATCEPGGMGVHDEGRAPDDRVMRLKDDRVMRGGDRQGRKECVEKLYTLLAQREHSRMEIQRKLVSRGFEEGLVDEVVSAAVSAHLVDDARFAEAYIRGKCDAGWGKRKIEAELGRRGIVLDEMPGLADAWLSHDDELRRARACVEGYHGHAKDRYGALYRRLLNKGFAPETCTAALKACGED